MSEKSIDRLIMQCIKCGKEMVSTTGGYYCPTCKIETNDFVNKPSCDDIPVFRGYGEPEGWICPICGSGVAPWVDVCPCRRDANVTTITTTPNHMGINVDLISLNETK